jgi:drug/metabolite transporter (DMT)-like permease
MLATNFVTAKHGLSGFNPQTFSLIWISASTIYSFLIALSFQRFRNQSCFRVPAGSRGRMILLGVFCGLAMVFAWSGLKHLDPTFQAFLFRFQPLISVLFGVLFLGETVVLLEVIAMGIMVSGALVSISGRWEVVGLGFCLSLLAAVSTAMQTLIGKERIHLLHPAALTFYRVGIGTTVVVLWVLIVGGLDFDVRLSCWLVTLCGGLLGPTLGYFLTFSSYRHWTLTRSSQVLILQPVFVFPMAWFFLDRIPALQELVGGGLVLAGSIPLVLLHFKNRRMRRARLASDF